jgi:threonyl-tRNA synthetase
VVATIVTDANPYAEKVVEQLKAAGIRVEADLRNEKINYKVREHSVGKVPNILVVGMREAEEGKVALRRLGQKEQEFLTLEAVVAMLKEEALAPDLKSAAK